MPPPPPPGVQLRPPPPPIDQSYAFAPPPPPPGQPTAPPTISGNKMSSLLSNLYIFILNHKRLFFFYIETLVTARICNMPLSISHFQIKIPEVVFVPDIYGKLYWINQTNVTHCFRGISLI